ncbi:gamma-glutamyltransferase [Teichococcus oryzae]|uniref:Glutathione hydrolase proenzyme n=1 Tax=Teichococcus oryzae TaxID=1608942 RepID=A0A5B2TAG9_9PROT|nr:gamma-glutamyltransferase [Pseudoroseomonas oryzae]KAA2211556.1 gamma-glutamyltransferase [Pseudoroseomonas oryzae]
MLIDTISGCPWTAKGGKQLASAPEQCRPVDKGLAAMMDPRRRSHRPLIMGRKAAVATNHPAATEAGLSMLRAGGNAADAAAAISLALGVAEPHMSGLGGDGFYHIWASAEARSVVYNGAGTAPAAADPAGFPQGMPLFGPASISTPGALAAVTAMHAGHGVLPWSVICQPAINLARDGVPVTHTYRAFAGLMRARLQADPTAAVTFLHDGEIPELGALLVQPDLACTLEEVAANGADSFYRGSLARRLAAGLRQSGALVAVEDLAAFEPEVQQPLSIRYRGFEVRQTPPNSTGFVLLQELKIVERFDLAALGEGSAELLHLLVEAKKLAFLDRERHAGDPRFRAVPLEHLLSDSYADELAGRIDPKRAASIPLQQPVPTDGNTTYFCVVDGNGNAVSAIQSLNNAFGSGTVAAGTGVLMNNRMNCWHLNMTHPNALQPGKRVRHTMNAPMVLRDGRPWAVFGTPGADNQVQVNLQTAVSLIDLGLDPQQIAEAPRWSSDQPGQGANWPHGGSDALTLEAGFPETALEGLGERGHNLNMIPYLDGPCSIACIRMLPNGVRMAGSDPRRDGWAGAL